MGQCVGEALRAEGIVGAVGAVKVEEGVCTHWRPLNNRKGVVGGSEGENGKGRVGSVKR